MHLVIIIRLTLQINGLTKVEHAPLVYVPYREKSKGYRTCSSTYAYSTVAALIFGSRPPPSLIHHLFIKIYRPPVASNI